MLHLFDPLTYIRPLFEKLLTFYRTHPKLCCGVSAAVLTGILSYVQVYTFTDAGKTKTNDWSSHQNQLISTANEINKLKIELTSARNALTKADLKTSDTKEFIDDLTLYSDRLVAIEMITGQYIYTGSYLAKTTDKLTPTKKEVTVKTQTGSLVLSDPFAQSIIKLKVKQLEFKAAQVSLTNLKKALQGGKDKTKKGPKNKTGTYVVRLPVANPDALAKYFSPVINEKFEISNELHDGAQKLINNYREAIDKYNTKVSFEVDIKNLIVFILGLGSLLFGLAIFIIDNRTTSP